MKIMTPTIFVGKKKKGKFSNNTRFFTEEVSIENLTKFFEGEVISHEVILSKTAALYDPLGFEAPLKVFGSFICRRALIESSGDPLREVNSDTRQLFMQYLYQVKMLDTLVFKRNKRGMERAKDDMLILFTDAGYHGSMMIMYFGHVFEEGLKIEFAFSIGNLNNESGNIPRNELDIMERGTK